MTDRSDGVSVATRPVSAPVWAIVVGVLGLAFAVMAISASVGANPYPWWVALPTQAVGLVFLGVGTFVWARQPDGRLMGRLLSAVGVTWYLGDLQFFGNPLLFRIGFWLYHLSPAVLAQLLLSYPDGRLTRRIERFVVVAAYATVVGTQGMRLLTEKPLEPQGWGPSQAPVSVWAPIGSVLGAALTATTLVLVIQRWLAEPRPARRARGTYWAAVLLLGAVMVALFAATLAHAPLGVQAVLMVLYAGAHLLLGAAVLVGALYAHMAHQRVTKFLTRMDGHGGAGGGPLRDALAEALEDRSLTLHYRRADSDEYVDSHGNPAPLPDGDGRAVTLVGPPDRPLAALVHDPFLAGQPQYRDRLAAVVAAARLALENARLSAQNRAHVHGVLDTEQAARRRIRAALHDGPQHQLSSIQLLVGQVRHGNDDPGLDAALERISAELQAAVQDLRDVTEDVYPAILRTKGLEDALDPLVQRSPVPLVLDIPPTRWPERVEETIFFLVSEAVGNAHKHAHADGITVRVWGSDSRVTVEVHDDGDGGAALSAAGSGIRGMRDRISAHDGTLTIASPPDGGTTVRAVLPCE